MGAFTVDAPLLVSGFQPGLTRLFADRITQEIASIETTVLSYYAVGNTTSSTTSGVNAVGSVSFDGAGAVSIGISHSSIVISAPTQTVQTLGLYAVGNTTGATSSMTEDARTISIQGAGLLSVGFSNGSLVLSATSGTTAASGTALNRFAVGNTTGTTSSDLVTLSAWSLSGAGGVSVGMSNNSLVISGVTTASQTVQTLGLYAVGNTTTSVSSMTADARSISFDGAGIISIGMSGGSVVISATDAAQTAPTLSLYAVGNTTSSVSSGVIAAGSLSFDGAGAVSVGISGSSVVISSPATVASGTAQNRAALGNTTSDSSSAIGTLSVLSVSGAGGVSIGYATNSSGVLVISGATTAAQTAPTFSLYAVGNTTTSVSSGIIGAGSLSFDGAGAVSVGISGSSVVISAPTQTAPMISLFAVGNTTTSVSSGVIGAGSLSFDGAGIVSIGISGSSVVISASTAATNPVLSLYAVGNTTTSVSSGVIAAGSLSLDGAGIVSVGISGSSVVISASTAATSPVFSIYAVGNTTTSVSSGVIGPGSLSFDGAGIASVGISGSSIVISASSAMQSSNSFFEPNGWIATSTATYAIGTMDVQAISLQAPVVMNQANFMSSRTVLVPSFTLSGSAASRTVTASGTWGSTASLVIYSRQGGTATGTFTTYTSTTAVFNVSAAISYSISSTSRSISQTVSFGWPQGTSAAVTSSMSNTFSTGIATASSFSSQVMNASSSLFTGWLRNDYPFLATLPIGDYLVGVMWSSASGTSTLSSGLIAYAAPAWNATNGVVTGPALTIAVPGAALSSPFPGIGSTSSAGSAVPGSIVFSVLSSAGSYPRDYLFFQQG